VRRHPGVCCRSAWWSVYDRPVDNLFLATARPWTYWIALPLTVMSVLGLLSVFVGYLRKAVAPKYPKQ
jgi:hypothetical protein